MDKNGQRNYTNFESNLAMMVMYLNVELESGNGNADPQTNGQMNGHNYTNFESNLAMMVIYLPVKFEFDWTKRFRVKIWKQKC